MQKFQFGRTWSRAFAMIRSTIGTVGVFMLVITLVNSVLSYLMRQRMLAAIGGPASDPSAALAVFGSAWYWAVLAVSITLACVGYAGSIDGFLKASAGRETSVGECFNTGFTRFLPVLGVFILMWIAIVLGFALFIVPGVILLTMWSASLGVLVGEDAGVTASMGRSRALTKGSRLVIFGVLIMALIVIYVPVLAFGGALVGANLTNPAAIRSNAENMGPVVSALTAIYGWFVAMVLNALMASIYVEAREVKEGGGSAYLDEVFG